MSKTNEELHEEADRSGKNFYRDAYSGSVVMTRGYLERRRYCCGSGCRHCPYRKEPKVEKEKTK